MSSDVRQLELFIAKLLRYGVLLAGALMLVGWLHQLSFTVDAFTQFHQYREQRLAPLLVELYEQREWWRLISYAGLFVLISLPILRVLMTFVIFVRTKDFLIAGISALVLFCIFLSVALGFEI